jgi:YidC/Oxa1 family membrane protein insertase
MNIIPPEVGNLFNQLLIYPLINVQVFIYDILHALHVPYAAGFSIIVLTIVIRLILYPLTNKQLRASKKMQEIAPHVANVKEKHKGDSKRIQEETMKLYKEHGVNPAAGCLPTLIQLPILLGLYQVLNRLVHLNPDQMVHYINSIVITPLHISAPWDPYFFGIPLGKSPHQLLTDGRKEGIILFVVVGLAIPVVTGLFQFVQSKMMFSSAPNTNLPATSKKNDDFSSVMQKQSAYLFPLMIGFFSFNFPFGLSLYWNTFSIFGIIQQYKISGWGGMEEIWQKLKTLQKKK